MVKEGEVEERTCAEAVSDRDDLRRVNGWTGRCADCYGAIADAEAEVHVLAQAGVVGCCAAQA